jgi:hypothetical protein
VVVAYPAPPNIQDLAQKMLGLRELALAHVQRRQVIHAGQRVGLFVAHQAAPNFHYLDVEFLRLGILALHPIHSRQLSHAENGERIFFAESPSLGLQSLG